MRLTPSGASARSLTSERLVVATGGSLVRRFRFGAAVLILESNDIVQLRRRDLDDGRVLDRRHAVHGPGREVEGGARGDDLRVQHALARPAELDPGLAGEHVPRLVLHLVELQAERLARADEEQLA